MPTAGALFPLLNDPPRLGGGYLIHVRPPFAHATSDPSPWVLFRPALSETNGWEAHPDEIPRSVLAQVAVSDVASSTAHDAWLTVKVLETLPLTGIVGSLPAMRQGSPLGVTYLPTDFGTLARTDSGTFSYIKFLYDGGPLEWVLCQNVGSEWHLLLHGESDYHSGYGESENHKDFVYAGHRVLSDEEWRRLTRQRGPA